MDITEYGCEQEYEMFPSNTGIIQCTKNGVWCPYESNSMHDTNGQFPRCELKCCLEQEPLTNGAWVLKDGLTTEKFQYPLGSVIVAACEANYELFGPKTKYCKEKLWWPLDITQCVKVTCDTEEVYFDLPHSVVHLSGEEVGDKATLSCKEGFQLTKAKASTAALENFNSTEVVLNNSITWICHPDGSWIMQGSNQVTQGSEEEWLACLHGNIESNISIADVQCHKPQVILLLN